MLRIQDYIPVTKAKSTFLDIIRKIEGSGDAIAITKNGVAPFRFSALGRFYIQENEVDVHDRISNYLELFNGKSAERNRSEE
jgi:hypothetical protein